LFARWVTSAGGEPRRAMRSLGMALFPVAALAVGHWVTADSWSLVLESLAPHEGQ
jgi:hypothetical protein